MLFDAEDPDAAPMLRRRKMPEADLDMTPMIDVTFLLLIFFMVGGRMSTDSTQHLELPPAKFGVGVVKPAATMVILRMTDGRTQLETGEGNPVDQAGLKTWITDQVLKNRRQVVLEAERDVPFRVVQETTRTIMEVNGLEFFVGVKEP